MRRWLVFFILCALAVPAVASDGEPIDPVELVQGWQMVSFPILEPKALEDFDVIDRDTGERKPFCEAYQAGWVDEVMHWYSPADHGYRTVGCGIIYPPDTRDVEPNRGYWLYVHPRPDPPRRLDMVPTYNITDYWPLDMGVEEVLDILENDLPGTCCETHRIDQETVICGIPCRCWHGITAEVCGGDPFPGWDWLEWFASDSDGLWYIGTEDPIGDPLIVHDPPILFPNRMYPGQVHQQIIQPVEDDCVTPVGEAMTVSVRLFGTERIRNGAIGERVSLKLELESVGPEGTYRSVGWAAQGVGPVRTIEWENDHLDGAEDLIDWTPPPG